MQKKTLSHYLDLMKFAQDKKDWDKVRRCGEIAIKRLYFLLYSHLEEYLLYSKLGSAYFNLKEYSHSLNAFYKSNIIASKNRLNPAYSAYAAFGIGYNFITLKNINQALFQFHKVEQYYQKFGYDISPMDKGVYFYTLVGFGMAYLYENKLEEAHEIIEEKIPPIIPFLKNKISLLNYYNLKGRYLIEQKNFKQARQSFQEYIKTYEQLNIPNMILDGKSHLATINLLEGHLDTAIDELNVILKEARLLKYNGLICTVGLLLGKSYALKGMNNKIASIERQIKPILNKLDTVWLYEKIKEFEKLYDKLQDVYNFSQIPEIKRLPQILSDAFKKQNDYSSLRKDIIIVGNTAEINDIHHIIKKVANTDLPILTQGETGTGKELVACAIHNNSLREEKPWLALNCGAIPETLLESELFGHAKGAFTDAFRDKKGYIELASEGTLLLDEIPEMSANMQQKLLRVLEEKQLWRLGAEKPIPINTRFIFASNKNIEELVKAKKFREDLYYRINTIVINLPPLRNRKDDIPLLVNYFLKRIDQGKKINDEALKLLMNYHWPGNIRELENEIKRICALYSEANIITESMLSDAIKDYKSSSELPHLSFKELKKAAEKNIILDALQKCNNNISQTAKRLGYDRASLYDKMKRLEINSSFPKK